MCKYLCIRRNCIFLRIYAAKNLLGERVITHILSSQRYSAVLKIKNKL